MPKITKISIYRAAGLLVIAAVACVALQLFRILSFPGLFTALWRGDDAKLDIAIDRGPQIVNSTLSPYAYPSIRVEANRPVRWIINAPTGSVTECNSEMVIGEYGISYHFRPGGNVIEFTPRRIGKVRYTCRRGVTSGVITVVRPSEAFSSLLENRQRAPRDSGEPCCPRPVSIQTESE